MGSGCREATDCVELVEGSYQGCNENEGMDPQKLTPMGESIKSSRTGGRNIVG